jgi:hypothetical protein
MLIQMNKIILGLLSIFIVLMSFKSIAKNVKMRKSQEVNFSEMSLNGTIRNPDGAYLVQKRGIKFLPLFQVQKNMDEKIRDAGNYVQ